MFDKFCIATSLTKFNVRGMGFVSVCCIKYLKYVFFVKDGSFPLSVMGADVEMGNLKDFLVGGGVGFVLAWILVLLWDGLVLLVSG